MSYANFVKTTIVAPLDIAATTITLNSAVAPFNAPAADGGWVVLADSMSSPTNVEIVTYSSRSGNVLSGVVRGCEGTAARNWTGTVYCYQPITAASLAADFATKEPAISTDAVTKFWSGTKTWRDLATDVRASVLTGLSVATQTAATATDTVLTAIGKLQGQINLAATNLATNVRGTVLTGLSTATNSAISAADTLLVAIGKLQAQLTNFNGSNITSGTIAAARVATLNQNTTGSSGSCTGNAATATSVAYAGITGKPTTLGGYGITDGALAAALDASALTSGTVPDARISGSYTGMTNLTGSGNVDFAKFLGNAADTVSAPSYSWTGDTNTGMYAPAADQIGFATGGVQRLLLNSSGATATTFNGALAGNAATATKLATARTINGVAFDGSANITIAAGETGRLPLTGGTLTGPLTLQAGSLLEAGRYIDFNFDGALNYDVRIETSNAVSNGSGILTVTASGGLVCTGNVTAYSDIRLKTDIAVIPNALAKVQALRGVTYERIETGERQTGVIAQEVQAVLPEAVMVGTDENETLSVAYGNLVGLLIEAIKELKAEVDELKGIK